MIDHYVAFPSFRHCRGVTTVTVAWWRLRGGYGEAGVTWSRWWRDGGVVGERGGDVMLRLVVAGWRSAGGRDPAGDGAGDGREEREEWGLGFARKMR
ncbi:hypothetical protein Tco_0804745 [Tanacetum coccineum]|uniref:Uncharacterized protein n=1 Tax=Tanacetum coccineum TaxID=301880 RepID=A0ABQ5A929_9ASTR